MNEIRAITAAAQYWTDLLKPHGTMPSYEYEDVLDNNGDPVIINQPVFIGIDKINAPDNAAGTPLEFISSTRLDDPYLVTPSMALLADGVTPSDENGNIVPVHGLFLLGTGFNSSPLTLSQTGRTSADTTTVAIHEFGHILGISSDLEENYLKGYYDEKGNFVSGQVDNNGNVIAGTQMYKFSKELNRWESRLRDNNGNSAVPGAYPNVDGKPVDYDSTHGKQYIFDMGDPNSLTQPANFTFVGKNTLELWYGKTIDELSSEQKNSGVPIQGLTPRPDYNSTGDSWWYDPGGTLSHIDARNSVMSWQMYRNYPMFIEIELAVMQDLGYNINRRDFFGRSFYVNGDGTPLYNSATFDSLSAYGVGAHLFANNLNIVQTGSIKASGPGAAGIRVDGVGNTLTIAQGTLIYAGLPSYLSNEKNKVDSLYTIPVDIIDSYRNYGVSVWKDEVFNKADGSLLGSKLLIKPDGALEYGVDGIGLLVSYGKDHNIIHQGTIIAEGLHGIGVRFDFGEPDVGARLGSYAFDPKYGLMEEGKITGGLPSDLQGPLVNSFDITGTIKGSKPTAGVPFITGYDYITIDTDIDISDLPQNIEDFLRQPPLLPKYIWQFPLYPYLHDKEKNGIGQAGSPDPNEDAVNGEYGYHWTITVRKNPLGLNGLNWLGFDPNPPDHKDVDITDEVLTTKEILVLFYDKEFPETKQYPKDGMLNGKKEYIVEQDGECWIITFDEDDNYVITRQPNIDIDIVPGGAIYIGGAKYDAVTSDFFDLREEEGIKQGGAYVKTINIMNGANIEGDIFSLYADTEERTTALTFGLKPDAAGKATSQSDPDFHFVFRDNINYIFPYFKKDFDVLPHELVLKGDYEYTDERGWHPVGDKEGRFRLADREKDPKALKSGFDLRFAGGFTEFGTLKTVDHEITLFKANISNVNSVVIDRGATLELSKVHTVHTMNNGTVEKRDITRTLNVADSFINNGRFSGESSIWNGGGWIWQDAEYELIAGKKTKIKSEDPEGQTVHRFSSLDIAAAPFYKKNDMVYGEIVYGVSDATLAADPDHYKKDEYGNIWYAEEGSWVGKRGGGVWIDTKQIYYENFLDDPTAYEKAEPMGYAALGTLINRGVIAPGPNNGYGEPDRYINAERIAGQRTGTLAIAGNLDMSSKNSVYEVTITDGRKTTANAPGWDYPLYWKIDTVDGFYFDSKTRTWKEDKAAKILTLETYDPSYSWSIDPKTGLLVKPDPSYAWSIDPQTGLPVQDEREVIGGGWGIGESDRLVVSGETKLGGTLQVLVTPGDYSPDPTTYTIIRSEGGYTPGTNFENIEHYIGFLTFQPYDLNMSNTYVNPYNSKELQFTVFRDADYFKKHGKTFNEIAAATAIDNSLFDSYRIAFSLGDNRNSTENLRNMYHQIAAAIRANSMMINLWSPSEVLFPRIGYGNGQMETGNRGRVNWNRIAGKKARMRGQTPGRERVGSLWGEVMNTSLNAESDGNSDGYNFNRTGLMVGNEWSLTPYSAVGAIVSYQNSTLKQVGDKVKSDDYILGTYFVAAPFNTLEFKAYMGLGTQEYDLDRRIYNANIVTDRVPLEDGYMGKVSGVNNRYTGQTRGNSFNLSLELAKPLELHPTFILRPTLGFDAQHVWQNGYVENNFSEIPTSYGSNLYALRFQKSHYNRGLLRAGFSSETSGQRGGIRMRAFYVSQIAGDRYPTSTAAFVTGGERFTVRGVDMGNNYLHLGVGANYWFDSERTSSLFFDYDANIYNVSYKVNAHIASCGLLQKF